MQLCETVLANLESDAARRIAIDEIDATPRDEARRNTVHNAMDSARGQALQQPTGSSAQPDLDVLNEQRCGVAGWTILGPGKVYVVDTDDLAAVDVYDLLIKQVAFKQERVAKTGDRMGR